MYTKYKYTQTNEITTVETRQGTSLQFKRKITIFQI